VGGEAFVGVAVGGTGEGVNVGVFVGVAVGGTGVDVGGSGVGVVVGGTGVAVGEDGIGVAAGASATGIVGEMPPHPTTNNMTNINPIIRCNKS
jgi:hypothetical protein